MLPKDKPVITNSSIKSDVSIAEELFDKPVKENQGLLGKNPVSWLDDKWNILFLFSLYLNQGLFIGYWESQKVILVEKGAKYSELANFDYVIYPFSFKFLLAPFTDTYYSHSFGKRKSYLVPLYYFCMIYFLVIARWMDDFVDSKNILGLVILGIISFAIIAIADICIDGWSVKLLREENRPISGFCQFFGQLIGGLIGMNLFLWLNSVPISNQYFWSTPRDYPLVDQKTFCYFLAVLTLIQVLCIHLLVNETAQEDELEEKNTFKSMCRKLKGFCVNPNFRYLLIVSLFLKVGYATNNAGSVIMQRKGFSREKIAFVSFITSPLTAIATLIGTFISRSKRDMTVFYYTLWIRIVTEIFSTLIVIHYSIQNEETMIYLIILNTVLGGFFVNIGEGANNAFSFRIAELTFGASVITIVNSFRNFSGVWPNTVVFYLMEYIEFWHLCVFGLIYQVLYLIFIRKRYIELESIPLKDWDPEAEHLHSKISSPQHQGISLPQVTTNHNL